MSPHSCMSCMMKALHLLCLYHLTHMRPLWTNLLSRWHGVIQPASPESPRICPHIISVPYGRRVTNLTPRWALNVHTTNWHLPPHSHMLKTQQFPREYLPRTQLNPQWQLVSPQNPIEPNTVTGTPVPKGVSPQTPMVPNMVLMTKWLCQYLREYLPVTQQILMLCRQTREYVPPQKVTSITLIISWTQAVQLSNLINGRKASMEMSTLAKSPLLTIPSLHLH